MNKRDETKKRGRAPIDATPQPVPTVLSALKSYWDFVHVEGLLQRELEWWLRRPTARFPPAAPPSFTVDSSVTKPPPLLHSDPVE